MHKNFKQKYTSPITSKLSLFIPWYLKNQQNGEAYSFFFYIMFIVSGTFALHLHEADQ